MANDDKSDNVMSELRDIVEGLRVMRNRDLSPSWRVTAKNPQHTFTREYELESAAKHEFRNMMIRFSSDPSFRITLTNIKNRRVIWQHGKAE